MIRTIYAEAGAVYVLDQNQLPARVEYEKINTHQQMADAIRLLKVRGAPLIGVAAAYGLALAVNKYQGPDDQLDGYYAEAEKLLAATRPTAVNLFWAIKRMNQVFRGNHHQPPDVLIAAMWHEAEVIRDEDIRINQNIGKHGQELLSAGARVLTICNAGALATCGYGTALGVIRSAHELHKINQVWVCETRPVLQGARLTIWELLQDRIPVTLITDNMAGYLMQQGRIDAVLVGADRIAANGDAANKIGTYSLAVLANYHHIPFYVAAPISTFDANIASGREIPIEERNQEEVRRIGGNYITVPEVEVYNPSFDVTPAALISGIITEAGLIKPPYPAAIDSLKKGNHL